MNRKRLYRSSDAVISGVCGGIGDYFGIDSNIKYTSTGYAECVDMLDYINSVFFAKNFADYVANLDGPKTLDDILKVLIWFKGD